MRIAIVGLGYSGTLVLSSLADLLQAGDPVEFLLFESSAQLGAGLPYGYAFNDECFILNMQTSLLGAHLNRPTEFFDWLSDISKSTTTNPASYVPRTQMGEYLASVLQKSLVKLSQLGIRYQTVQDEIGNIQTRGREYLVFGATHTYTVDRIVLALGHLRKRARLPDTKRYIANPYHELERVYSIPASARVGILGSKLTAVDMSILLHTRGATQISMFSSSGRLPLVRGVRPPESEIPTAKRPDDVSLLAFVQAIRIQAQASSSRAEYHGFISGNDGIARIEQELLQAKYTRLWHTILDETKIFIDDYWHKLNRFHKYLFLRKYQGIWMSYRHPMPLVNARKIAAMLRDGSLSTHAGYRGAVVNKAGNIEVTTRATGITTVDYLIDATGTPSNIRDIDSVLLLNLLRSGLISPCEFGGVEFDPVTHRTDPASGLYVIGQITRGRLFYVSALERLAVHASTIAHDLMASISALELMPEFVAR